MYVMHSDQTNSTLYDILGKEIDFDTYENIYEYYILYLKSKDANLYRNITILPYLWNKEWNNQKKMIAQNTWE